MSDIREKRFLTYEKQIELLKSKKLTIEDENKAIEYLKQYSYYSLIPGKLERFKQIRKIKSALPCWRMAERLYSTEATQRLFILSFYNYKLILPSCQLKFDRRLFYGKSKKTKKRKLARTYLRIH